VDDHEEMNEAFEGASHTETALRMRDSEFMEDLAKLTRLQVGPYPYPYLYPYP
jgi:hypothetical protein